MKKRILYVCIFVEYKPLSETELEVRCSAAMRSARKLRGAPACADVQHGNVPHNHHLQELSDFSDQYRAVGGMAASAGVISARELKQLVVREKNRVKQAKYRAKMKVCQEKLCKCRITGLCWHQMRSPMPHAGAAMRVRRNRHL
jgi:hypothetical protein